jgi:hypothetical protein
MSDYALDLVGLVQPCVMIGVGLGLILWLAVWAVGKVWSLINIADSA